jgi:hypothetical protein
VAVEHCRPENLYGMEISAGGVKPDQRPLPDAFAGATVEDKEPVS